MLNYETLLSSYDDKLTLMQWLKKVEDALKNASAVSFNVNKRGDATISFSIVFEDGSEIESGEIVLEQGESVASANIVNGHLILTLTNGDELDAGDLGAVSGFSIDGSQHLIVTYQNGTTQDLGAIFTGNVNIAGNLTADSIIENMTGYSFSTLASDAGEFSLTYAGVVKNGNKLTFVIAGTLTPTSIVNIRTMGRFNIPLALANLIYPISGDIVAYRKLDIFTSRDNSVSVSAPIYKYSGNRLDFCIQVANLTAGTSYYFRNEVTFLLSDNLAA